MLALLVLAAPLVRAQEVTLQVAENPTLGPLLTDGAGMTLYRFTRDEPGISNCTGECLAIWPPLLVEEGTPAAGEDVTGQIATIERDDGTLQVTYNDMPLYYFANDAAAGDTNGQGVGDVWYVVHPDAPGVTVDDQPIENDTVSISRVVIAEPGWLVVHAQAEGRPGPILGQSPVDPGENTDVMVQLDTAGATETLYAMLHSDRGTIGTFEFPDGADVPVTVGGQVVTPSFSVTGGLPAEAPAQQEATEAPATATPPEETTTAAPTAEVATPTPQSAPPTLPETGNPAPPGASLWLLGAAVLAVVGGLSLLVARRGRIR